MLLLPFFPSFASHEHEDRSEHVCFPRVTCWGETKLNSGCKTKTFKHVQTVQSVADSLWYKPLESARSGVRSSPHDRHMQIELAVNSNEVCEVSTATPDDCYVSIRIYF